jgi:hypothetical protein
MDDKILLNISIAVAISGILLLMILSFYNWIPESNSNDLRCEDVGKYVKMTGRISNIQLRNSSTSIRIEQKCFQDIFIFGRNEELRLNETITVHGTIQEYNGRLSILADRITR